MIDTTPIPRHRGDVDPPSSPLQRTLRTAVAVGLGSLVALVLVLPEILRILADDLGQHLPPEMTGLLLAAAATVTALATALTRIMAIPAVNTWLSRWGLGATPRRAREGL